MKDSEEQRLESMWSYESVAYKNYKLVAGVDEAGRGPLAGPVVAAACILPFSMLIEGLNDSKKLTPKKRKLLFQHLCSHEKVHYSYSLVEASVIDEVNIFEATKIAMKQAVAKLDMQPDCVLIDGLHLHLDGKHTQKIIKGDSLSCSIAAASVIAKETRDEWMMQADEKWPEYGFAKHKGYGTKQHMEAIKNYGPCPIHRASFSPIKEMLVSSYLSKEGTCL
ncbi:MAG: ribonuclease HII [Chlamydiales bacterium]|nr:ribonuclease HII [Chlamydiales bacterium]NCF71005.1 ribonuclease HII [Chlamydiales bacterium]